MFMFMIDTEFHGEPAQLNIRDVRPEPNLPDTLICVNVQNCFLDNWSWEMEMCTYRDDKWDVCRMYVDVELEESGTNRY